MLTDEIRNVNHSDLYADPTAEEKITFAASPASSEGRDQKRQNLVALLRGYFACPVISTLGELGIADLMLADSFSVADFEGVGDQRILTALFRYLHSIGLLRLLEGDRYELTAQGRTAVSRNGAFSLLTSYTEYFDMLPSLVTGVDRLPSVNRKRNVRGSGQLHSKKFFPAAFEFFESNIPTAVIDVGCGDGCFLEHVLERWPDVEAFGVDLSETAVDATNRRLQAARHSQPVAVAADGFDIRYWSSCLPEKLRTSSSVTISMWFVAHEFSRGIPERIVEFFSVLHGNFPLAQVVLGEITNIPPEILAMNCALSIMPEYLLFHELSSQGVLGWSDWQTILGAIPYQLKGERRFDQVRTESGVEIPASFVWLLQPKASKSLSL